MSIEKTWYGRHPLTFLLFPVSLLFGLIAALRRGCYQLGLCKSHKFSVPVIVVGNITVGGTGKTPLVIWLATHLRDLGYKPGIVSRGYGGKAASWPQQVTMDSDPEQVGDEAVLISVKTGCPMVVGPDRSAAVDRLLSTTDSNIVISDDGLQHYAMSRDLEIVVVDGRRGFGNGMLLPAGPLRERPGRLAKADLVISNGDWQAEYPKMEMRKPRLVALNNPSQIKSISDFSGVQVHAVAGTGHPQRFFELLEANGLHLHTHVYPDHHAYKLEELRFTPNLPVLMTEKDGVKCRQFPLDDCWVVPVEAQPDTAFVEKLDRLVEELNHG